MTGTPADASALIYLAKAEAFALAALCIGSLDVPPSVWREAAEAWQHVDAEEVGRMRVARQDGILKRVELSGKAKQRAGDLAARCRLGAGESEVLALAQAGARVVLDDERATRVARDLGLSPIRTLWIPVLGATRDTLSVPVAVEMLHRLAVVSGAPSRHVTRLEFLLRGHPR